jgi:hypothetical protein
VVLIVCVGPVKAALPSGLGGALNATRAFEIPRTGSSDRDGEDELCNFWLLLSRSIPEDLLLIVVNVSVEVKRKENWNDGAPTFLPSPLKLGTK